MKKQYLLSIALLLVIALAVWVMIPVREDVAEPAGLTSRPAATDSVEAVHKSEPLDDMEESHRAEIDMRADEVADVAVAKAEFEEQLRAMEEEEEPRQEPEEEAQPPFMDSELGALTDSPTESAVSYLAAVSRHEAGPASLERAAAYLQAQDAVLPYVGARMLVQEAEWTEEILDQVLNHDNMGVPLYIWQGLLEEGRVDDAEALTGELARRVGDFNQWGSQLINAPVPGTTARGLINLAEGQLSPDDFNEMLNHLVDNEGNDYAARMRALREQRLSMPFETYRDRVHAEMVRSSEGADPIWFEGVRRLALELEGPLPIVAGPMEMTPDVVDMMEAHEYPATLEDIAQRVEIGLRAEDTVWGEGIVERLNELLAKYERWPLDESEKQALHRLAAAVGYIDESEVSSMLAGPPVE